MTDCKAKRDSTSKKIRERFSNPRHFRGLWLIKRNVVSKASSVIYAQSVTLGKTLARGHWHSHSSRVARENTDLGNTPVVHERLPGWRNRRTPCHDMQ